MKTRAIIERGKDGTYSIYTPDLSCTIVGEGETIEKAKEDFLIGADEMRDSYMEKGEPLPHELEHLEFAYEYDTASVLEELSPLLNMTAFARSIGINPSLIRQYKRGQHISPRQSRRIQDGILQLGNRLSAYSFA